MARAKERPGFGHELLEVRGLLRTDFGCGGAVRRDVNLMIGSLPGAELHGFQVRTGENGGIHERGQRRGLELNRISRLACHRQCSAKVPPGGQTETRHNRKVIALLAKRVEQYEVPIEHRNLRARRRAGRKPFCAAGGEEVERNFNRFRALRHNAMVGKHVFIVPAPGDRFSRCAELHSRHVADGPVGAVLAGDPFRIHERQRTRRRRNFHPGMKNAPRRFPQVHGNANGMRGVLC